MCEGRIYGHQESFEREEGVSNCSRIAGVNKPELSQAMGMYDHLQDGKSELEDPICAPNFIMWSLISHFSTFPGSFRHKGNSTP